MSYTEIVERLEAIEAKTATPASFDGAIATDWFAVAMEVHNMARQVTTAIAEEQAREAAMIADWEARQDAMADAVSAGWGHD